MRQVVKSCFIFLTALEDQPDPVKAAGGQILFGDIEIDVPAVSEHQLEVTLLHGIQLEQQHPAVTGRFFRPLTDMFYDKKSRDISLEEIYRVIFEMERIQTDNLTKDILRRFKYSQNLFPDVKDEDEADFLSRFAFICLLSFDAYLKKQLVERLIDETLSDEAKQKKDK